ncbi:MAG: NAD(P)H-dependent oxidoreductase [Rhodococcus sp.]|nr:NAD(P)H-dependent oxidoreductase [Rhodococcus sp. (in: high G+C Gram-positive bacteria)]
MQPEGVDTLRLEIIIGSTRVGRVAPHVAEWFAEQAREHGAFDIGVLDLADYALPVDLDEDAVPVDFRERIAAADAFVVVTPEYNHGYPAALKLALDSLKSEWRTKSTGFVSYGGPGGGIRAVEQLRQVVVELHMTSVRQAVHLPRIRKALADNGTLRDRIADPIALDAAPRMLSQLQWWASATKQWGSVAPYPG